MKTGIHPKYRDICCRLLETGMLPKSECGQSLTRSLKPLFDSGVLRWEKSAGGQRLAIVNQAAFGRWFSQHYPDSPLTDGMDSSRIRSVAQFRNTKALRSNLPEIVCVRSSADGVLFHEAAVVETTRATKEHGLFAFTLTEPTPYALRGFCALIENPAVFHLFERLQFQAALAIWTAGISSNRFVDWLAANVQKGLRVLHMPDYDPAGLSEFLRLHDRLGESVTLYLPDDLPSLFRRHSNRSLLDDAKNQRTLMKLRRSQHPSVRQVVALIDECNGGLEHEAVFIRGSSSD